MVYRLPDRFDASLPENIRPSKFIVLIVASLSVVGTMQIARSVSDALDCPLFRGESLHETCAKAASVGAPTRSTNAEGDEQAPAPTANEARYQRMWLSKMTRTGLLFPDESRPAGSEFSGFGGASSTSTSRRGSSSSVASDVSDAVGSTSSIESSVIPSDPPMYINKPPALTQFQNERLGQANPVLMVVTHPQLESWHKVCIREAVGDYDIGVIFAPLDEDGEMPLLVPLDPRTMANFGPLGTFPTAGPETCPTWNEEVVLKVDLEARVEDIAQEIVENIRNILST
ncbi:hypothetical protein MBLNU459_g3920t1 [Dothideomycetes sp. NU459]